MLCCAIDRQTDVLHLVACHLDDRQVIFAMIFRLASVSQLLAFGFISLCISFCFPEQSAFTSMQYDLDDSLAQRVYFFSEIIP